MKGARTLSGLVVGAGLILAALFAAPQPPRWGAFAASVVLMAIGLVGLQFSFKREKQQSPAQGLAAADLSVALKKLESELGAVLSQLGGGDDPPAAEDLGEQLTEIQVTYFVPVAENRDQLIERWGIKRYANFMIPFATAERYFNRGVSAAMDGYLGEAVQALKECLPHVREAIEKVV